MQRLKEMANRLQFRPDDFPGLLEKLGFSKCERLGVIGVGGELFYLFTLSLSLKYCRLSQSS